MTQLKDKNCHITQSHTRIVTKMKNIILIKCLNKPNCYEIEKNSSCDKTQFLTLKGKEKKATRHPKQLIQCT